MPPNTAGTKNSRPTQSAYSGVPGLALTSSPSAGPHDERQHQQLVDVEREADRRDGADQPLGAVRLRVFNARCLHGRSLLG